VSVVTPAHLRNVQCIARDAVPRLEPDALAEHARARVPGEARIVAFFGWPAAHATPDAPAAELLLVTARDRESRLELVMTTVGAEYPALAPAVVSAARFEREICEQLGIRPAGHPWLKPLRSHAPYGPGPYRLHDPALGIGGDYPFFRVEGEEVHEVAVGPVHAGIIEPGHFRFQCYGERVLHLEIMLGYQHRGFERALVGGPYPRTVHQVEELAGDTTVGHALAYAQALEALGGCEVPARAHALRALALELERLAAHTGDLGALAGDVAFMPTAAYCGRLRGELLNMTALLCGNRFGRGFVRPGGVAYDVDARMAEELRRRLDAAMRDLEGPLDLFFESSSVTERLEGTGPVSLQDCEALGLVGPVARACGAARDVRHDHPAGMYRTLGCSIATAETGDVYARAMVRRMEIERSAALVRELLAALPEGSIRAECPPPAPGAVAVSMVEGWRGEIAHVALTDAHGRFERYKVVDPSFHNWPGLELALRGQQISDFPLCNKSFNLSYAGHDL
jgi:Ni,Fe-hydrogenase III large subunit